MKFKEGDKVKFFSYQQFDTNAEYNACIYDQAYATVVKIFDNGLLLLDLGDHQVKTFPEQCRLRGKRKRRKKPLKIYEVLHDGPCGSIMVSAHRKRKNAEKAKAEWDKTHTHAWDKAVLIVRTVKP